MKKKTRNILLSVLTGALLLCAIAGGTVYYYLFAPQFHPSKTVYVYVDRDDTADSIYNKIRQTGHVNKFTGFQWMAKYRKFDQNIHTGRYAIRPNENYQVYWDMSVDDFFKRMQTEHKRFWNDERLAQATAIGMTPEEVCTLASIVEEETNNNEEKPMVAGLYINRLHTGMPLQADPTIKFALQDFGLRRITNEHLKVNSPYNTYINSGLPPGPIRIPSKKGLDSVLNYTKHNYIYMCAKEDFSGTHNFASNYADHMANARKYWKALNERKIFK